MEERFRKTGKIGRTHGGGFYLVSESGRETSVDNDTFSVWSMFNDKTVDEIVGIMMSDRTVQESKKIITGVTSKLEKAGLLVKI